MFILFSAKNGRCESPKDLSSLGREGVHHFSLPVTNGRVTEHQRGQSLPPWRDYLEPTVPYPTCQSKLPTTIETTEGCPHSAEGHPIPKYVRLPRNAARRRNPSLHRAWQNQAGTGSTHKRELEIILWRWSLLSIHCSGSTGARAQATQQPGASKGRFTYTSPTGVSQENQRISYVPATNSSLSPHAADLPQGI